VLVLRCCLQHAAATTARTTCQGRLLRLLILLNNCALLGSDKFAPGTAAAAGMLFPCWPAPAVATLPAAAPWLPRHLLRFRLWLLPLLQQPLLLLWPSLAQLGAPHTCASSSTAQALINSSTQHQMQERYCSMQPCTSCAWLLFTNA
jgi:hypothetical protein